jgi:hypothetical protein
MVSSTRLAANRANAKRSTGPRTEAGKSRSRLNALKHGLALAASAVPGLEMDVMQLAQILAGAAKDDPLVIAAAVRVAEAAIDVLRARRARVELMRQTDLSSDLLPPVKSHDEGSAMMKKRQAQPPSPPRQDAAVEVMLNWSTGSPEIDAALKDMKSTLEKLERHKRRPQSSAPPDREAALSELTSQLEKLERYERRSRSRRDSAIKVFERTKAAARKS